MGDIQTTVLSLALIYGYPFIGGIELISSIGVPLPMVAILLASGSLAAVGDLNLVLLCLVVTVCSIAGDCVDYYLGRRFGSALLAALVRKSLVKESAVARARRQMLRWSGASIFLSRWLFTPVSSLVSLLAGTSAYPLRSFLLIDVTGNVINAVLYIGIGYLLGANWMAILNDLNGVPLVATVAVAGVVLLLLGITRLVRQIRVGDRSSS